MKKCVQNVCLNDRSFLAKINKQLQKQLGIFAVKLRQEAAVHRCSSEKVFSI